MQADSVQKSSSGYPLHEDELIHLSVIDFIEKNISFFIKDYIDNDSEKALNSNFVLCMNNQIVNELFIFQHEDIENTSSGTSPSVDIGLYTRKNGQRGQRFFAIEAKRLTNSLSKKRKKEYVVGRFENGKFLDTGAIERFKKEIHGNGLTYAGILGYIQIDNFNSWKTKINTWIDEEISSPSSKELTWDTHEKLVETKSTKELAKYSSIHSCSSKKQIHLTHLWINLI